MARRQFMLEERITQTWVGVVLEEALAFGQRLATIHKRPAVPFDCAGRAALVLLMAREAFYREHPECTGREPSWSRAKIIGGGA